MKTPPLKLLWFLLLVLLSAPMPSQAQGGPRPPEGRPGGREVKAYFEASVLPVLRQQRQKLEAQLAADDRAQLATYRRQLQTLKEKGQALRQSLMAADAPQGRFPELTDAQREQFFQLRKETRSIMTNVAQIAQKYEANITKLAEEVQPQKEKWTADIKAIVVKNATPEQQEHLAKFAGHWRGYSEMHRFLRPVMFLLMEPAATESTERTLGATSFYPNPAAATSQLDYEVKKAGPVTVNLLDKNGNQLRTLLNEPNAEKGAHTQTLNLSDLPAGTYYYQIITTGAKETKRFVKE
ncbi:T9SS type A sorting domain-containing protein [Hymenobacter properus]|uniref:T9SS type A sorting domain-containing protein n=1 Tax=Hymenobacter properus TaxID=2791026 RepID=A0A931BJA7_9BACT|nr:T9SS type A sorting domain-containing protein [Hymenobacter properus]MBF9143327.1 T9SS type A sorting domain-containing protein [Hymenobacter properus]MBR7722137.1 T9SS type A sorting domain-containing protein [Microvirga sp. SRT04]